MYLSSTPGVPPITVEFNTPVDNPAPTVIVSDGEYRSITIPFPPLPPFGATFPGESVAAAEPPPPPPPRPSVPLPPFIDPLAGGNPASPPPPAPPSPLTPLDVLYVYFPPAPPPA